MNFGDKILLNITGYNCFLKVGDKESQTSCADYNHKIMKEIENLKFTKMKIMGGSEVGITNDLIYDGDYVNDLTNIITKKGKYQIEINLEHKPISSVLIFILEVN